MSTEFRKLGGGFKKLIINQVATKKGWTSTWLVTAYRDPEKACFTAVVTSDDLNHVLRLFEPRMGEDVVALRYYGGYHLMNGHGVPSLDIYDDVDPDQTLIGPSVWDRTTLRELRRQCVVDGELPEGIE